MAAPNLDDLLSEEPDPKPAIASEDDEAPQDEFSMHAADFLDDSLEMSERIEALRNAILAAGGSPLGAM